ncbi:MAG: energy-coupling factor ABC transporter substrate-binding protein [Fischerella sp.]|jgi:cobalt/nickel transport protein|uniref:energy-coupling factor ABC transporter substrate-binding protein n=1 Tax=Fischerella sp. TaxID=1191 RepID=UPI0017D991E1|nr:energy-coupling factor ABC transporter substrate-binding protein [Fischerella sp.]NWF60366.1 energy-coupling factor ABC transporter substrate-binding protein [Fischerella sp.]
MTKIQNHKWNNWLLLLAVVALSATPIMLIKDAEFSGSDEQAESAIKEIQPQYKPWFNSLIELPSGEVESLLFSVQAAAGAGVIGYVIGLYKGRSERQNHHNENSD